MDMRQQTPVLGMPGCTPNSEAYMIVLLLGIVQGSLNNTGSGWMCSRVSCAGMGKGAVEMDSRMDPRHLDRLG